MHLFLGIGITYLYMTCGGMFAESLGCCRHAVNAVLSNPPPAHDYKIAGSGGFFVAGPSGHPCGHYSHGGDKYQTFAQVAFIKKEQSVRRGYSTFVSAVPYPLYYSVQKASGMKMRAEISGVVARADAEAVHTEYQP